MKRKLAPGSDFSSKKVQQHMSRDENSTRDAQCADGLVCHAFPERGFIRQHDVAQHRHKVEGKRGGEWWKFLPRASPASDEADSTTWAPQHRWYIARMSKRLRRCWNVRRRGLGCRRLRSPRLGTCHIRIGLRRSLGFARECVGHRSTRM